MYYLERINKQPVVKKYFFFSGLSHGMFTELTRENKIERKKEV